MYNAVIAYCNNNTATIAALPAFQTALTAVETIVDQIRNTIQLQAGIINGIAMDKSQLRVTLCGIAADICAIISAFASITKNNELKEKVNFSATQLKRLSDEMVVPICANIHDALSANIAALASYGVTAEAVTNFQTAMDTYKAKISSPRNAISQRSAYNTLLERSFSQANEILKNQMDKMAVQFKTTNTAFYNAYTNNRTIVSPGTSATQITGTVTNSVTDDPLPGVTVQVVGQPLTTVTNENGVFVLKSVSPGSRSIKVNIAGYGDMQQDDLLVKLGKTTDANVAVTPKA